MTPAARVTLGFYCLPYGTPGTSTSLRLLLDVSKPFR